MLQKNIEVIDNIFSNEEITNIYDFCKTQKFTRTENDGENLEYTGLVSSLTNKKIINLILTKTGLKKIKIKKSYINLFLKDEKPYFHIDSYEKNAKTLLYYVNPNINNINNYGETFFHLDNILKGIPYVSGRILIFDADIPHRASSFRDLDRFTIAIKW